MNVIYVSTPLKDTYGGGEKFVENLAIRISENPKNSQQFIGFHPSLSKKFEKIGIKTISQSFGDEPVIAKNILKIS